MVKGDGEMYKLHGLQQFADPRAQLQEQLSAAEDEHISTVLTHKSSKDAEYNDFFSAMSFAKDAAAAESKEEIRQYNDIAKKELTAVTETSEQPYAVIQYLHKQNDALFEKLMELEVSSSERYAESISAFESAYEELAKKTLEVISSFFGRLRDFEAAYNERIVVGASELLEKVAADQGTEYLHPEVQDMLRDKDTLMGVINGAHDARVARLDAKEDEMRTLEDGACKGLVKKVVDSEYTRNRTRVMEIWNICHVVNRNELAAERFDE